MSSGSSSPAVSGPSAGAAANGAPAGATPSLPSPAPSTQQGSGIQTSSPTGHAPPHPGIQPAGVPHRSGPGSSDAIPNDPFYTIQYINDPAWPSDLRLDPSLSNWSQWSRCLRLLCRRQGLGVWLEGSFTPPDKAINAHAYRIWHINDQSIQAFILQNISEQDYKDVCELTSARTMFAELREHYVKLGSHTQILLMEKAIRTEFTPGTHLAQTWDKLDMLMRRVKAMGPLDYDQLQIACAIKGLGKHYEHLQSTLQSITNQPGFTLRDIARRIIEEDNLIRNHEEQGLLPTSAAFASQTAGKSHTRTTCSHCKRVGHFMEFCIQPGGKMAGRTLDEAKAAYRASRGQQKAENNPPAQSTSANVAATNTQALTTGSNVLNAPIFFGGVAYNLVPATQPVPSVAPPPTATADGTVCALASASITTLDADYDFIANIAICGEPRASVNWNEMSKSIDLNQVPIAPVAYTASRIPIQTLEDSPFFLDTGANAHISPERSDFKMLRAISPHPIAGVGRSCIYAVGIGTIDIHIAGGHKLVLDNVLFAPASTVHLISVLNLNRSNGRYVSCFNHDSFWLVNASGATILRSSVHENRRLYALSLSRACTTHTRGASTNATYTPKVQSSDTKPTSALLASRTPDVETWHRRLGHCNFGAIVDMAQKHAVEGMTINLSSSPPKCDACVRGKQTRTPVSKVREGEKATQPLGRVFVDLCGPIRPVSFSGQLYSMNIIDDYSSYV